MYIFKNAIKNITRNKGRNVLIGIIIFVVTLASTIALAITNTSSYLIQSYEDSFDVEATISFNRMNMREDFDFTKENGMEDMKEAFEKMESLTVSEIKEYADSEYVNDYYYTTSLSLNGSDIEKVSSEFSFGKGGKGSRNPMGGNAPDSGDFTLKGYISYNTMEEFVNGNYTLKESNEDVLQSLFDGKNIIINSELAELNEIELNDTIKLVDPNNEDKTYKFTVVGIYEESTASEEQNGPSMFSSSANTIITNSNILEEISSKNENLVLEVSPVYYLKSFEEAENFQNELYEKGLNEYYSVSTNESEITNATSSIKNVSVFAKTFLVITLIIGIIVLFVINQINIRERKYEIGVLRTIGMKKTTLTLQFIVELMLVGVFSMILAIGVGSLSSKNISNSLLASEISSSQDKMSEINENFGGRGNMSSPGMNEPERPEGTNRGEKDFGRINGIVQVQAFDSIDAVVNFEVILELLIIGIVLILASSISSMISIQRFSPLEILKERS